MKEKRKTGEELRWRLFDVKQEVTGDGIGGS